MRIPAAKGEYRRMELRSPDPTVNPYVAFTLLIAAALDGIENKLVPPEAVDHNLYTVGPEVTSKLSLLPQSYEQAKELAIKSEFIRNSIPLGFLR